MFHSQIHHFSSSPLLQTTRKGMGFSSFSKYFIFIALDFLIFELMLSFEKLEFRIWVGSFCWVWLNGFYWLWQFDVCFACFHGWFSFLSCVSCLYCAVHFMPLVDCHNDSYLWLCGVHRLHCTLLCLFIHHIWTPHAQVLLMLIYCWLGSCNVIEWYLLLNINVYFFHELTWN